MHVQFAKKLKEMKVGSPTYRTKITNIDKNQTKQTIYKFFYQFTVPIFGIEDNKGILEKD